MSQAMIFLYQKFTKSVKKCSQGFSFTSPGGGGDSAIQLSLSVKCLKCCYLSNSHIKPWYFCIKSSRKARRNAPKGLTLPHLGGFAPPSPGKCSAIARFSSAFLMFGKPLIQFAGAVARFFVPGVSRDTLPRKIFKIKGPRLAHSQHIALLLNLDI